MRQAHHWAALIFIGAIAVHLCRIFFTGAFRRPREINWLVGLTMLLLAVLNGFAGYSLPDDLLSGTGLRIAAAVLLSIPVVGAWLQFLVFGGEFPGQELEQRMYAAHILLIPGLIAVLITVHMAVLIRQKHTQFPGPGRRDSNVVGSRMWPTYAFRSISLLCGVAAAVVRPGWPRPDQSDLALGPLQSRRGHRPRPAGLVRRVAGRRAAPVPAVGVPRLRVPGPQRVLGRRGAPG